MIGPFIASYLPHDLDEKTYHKPIIPFAKRSLIGKCCFVLGKSIDALFLGAFFYIIGAPITFSITYLFVWIYNH